MQFFNLATEFSQSFKVHHFSSFYINFWGFQIPTDRQMIYRVIIDINKTQGWQSRFEKVRSIIDCIIGDKNFLQFGKVHEG